MRAVAPALLLAQLAPPALGDTMKRVSLKSKCIDGSPAAYYIAANASSKQYVVWLEGGGICQSLADCKNRARGALGSSKSYPATQKASRGMLMSDASNPDFASWNRIYVPYCSGDVWTGQMTEALNPWSYEGADPWKGYFSGHNIVAEVVSDLKKSRGASAATDVVLTGCSAGGIGTFINCDYVGDAFPAAKVGCRPEAGYFGVPIVRMANWSQGKTSCADMYSTPDSLWQRYIQPYTNETAAVDACVKDTHGGRDLACCKDSENPRDCCNAAPNYYPYTKTPMFISQSTMDAYQVEAQGGAKSSDAGYIKYLHDQLAGSLTEKVVNGPKRATDGLFAVACLQHCLAWSGAGAPEVDGKTDMEQFGAWYFKRGARCDGCDMHLDNSTDPKKYVSRTCAAKVQDEAFYL